MALVSSYIFEGNCNDSTGNYNSTYERVNYGSKPNGTDIPGGSILFDGTSSYVTFGNQLGTNYNTYTLEFWFRSRAATASDQCIFQRCGSADGSSQVGAQKIGNNGYYSIDDYAPSGGSSIISTNYANNTWYHTASVRNGNSNRLLYINGVNVLNNTSAETPAPTSAVNFSVMGQDLREISRDKWFNGELAYFRIWNEALSAATIASHYAQETLVVSQNTLRIPRRTRFSGEI